VDAALEGDSRHDLRAGGALLARPHFFVLIVFFGVYALLDGIPAIVAGIRGSQGRSWLFVAEGVLGVLAVLEIVSPLAFLLKAPAHTDGR
jgi:uncharacterized membrane protein HdeD (DUF308 family)